MRRVRWWAVVVVAVLAAAVQAAVFDQLRFPAGARLDLALLVVVGAALAVVVPVNAARIGAAVGLVVDLTQTAPFGINLLLFGLAGYLVAVTREGLAADGVLTRSLQGALASLVVAAFQYALARVFGLDPPAIGVAVVAPLLVAAAIAAIVVHPAVRLGEVLLVEDRFRR